MTSHGACGEDAWDFLATIEALRSQLTAAREQRDADAETLAKEIRAAEDRGMAKMARRVRHDTQPPCAVALESSHGTVVYLRDGTKVVLHREKDRAWLAIEPQYVLTPQDSPSTPTKGSP